jgi:subtilase family serine protease
MGLRPMPDVLSLSWANEGGHNLGYIVSIIATDAVIAKMTVMGTTVIAASGDYGQFGFQKPFCGGKTHLRGTAFC